MNSIQLRYYLEVAKWENMSKAAEQLYVAQSTLSRQISRLEEELGAELFERKASAIVLTEAGRLLAKEAEKILEKWDWIKLTLHAGASAMPLVLRIGCVDGYLNEALRIAIEQFGEKYPEVEVILHNLPPLRLFQALENQDLDGIISICGSIQPGDNYARIPIDESNRLMAVVPRKDELSKKPELDFPDLCGKRLYHYNETKNGLNGIMQGMRMRGLQAKYEHVQNVSEMIFLVSAGKGVGFVGSSCAFRKADGVVFLPFIGYEAESALQFIYQETGKGQALSLFAREVQEAYLRERKT